MMIRRTRKVSLFLVEAFKIEMLISGGFSNLKH